VSHSTLSLVEGSTVAGEPRPENGIFDKRDLRFAPTGERYNFFVFSNFRLPC
jgi:hypothetical protein